MFLYIFFPYRFLNENQFHLVLQCIRSKVYHKPVCVHCILRTYLEISDICADFRKALVRSKWDSCNRGEEKAFLQFCFTVRMLSACSSPKSYLTLL